MEIIHIKDADFNLINNIVELEKDAFQGGNVDLWIIKALIRYGLVYIVKEDDKIISIAEYMQVFNKKTVFLYGLSTLMEYRKQGFASFLLKETEKILKDLNFEEIELTVDPTNEVAIKLYINHGYSVEKFLKDEYGKSIDRYVMKKSIK